MFDPMSWLRFRKPQLRKWVVLCALLLSTLPVAAINTVLNFDATQSDSPTFDPTGALLQPLFQHVETFYQDVFEDTAANTTLTIDYWYQDLAVAPQVLSQHPVLGRHSQADVTFGSTAATGIIHRNNIREDATTYHFGECRYA